MMENSIIDNQQLENSIHDTDHLSLKALKASNARRVVLENKAIKDLKHSIQQYGRSQGFLLASLANRSEKALKKQVDDNRAELLRYKASQVRERRKVRKSLHSHPKFYNQRHPEVYDNQLDSPSQIQPPVTINQHPHSRVPSLPTLKLPDINKTNTLTNPSLDLNSNLNTQRGGTEERQFTEYSDLFATRFTYYHTTEEEKVKRPVTASNVPMYMSNTSNSANRVVQKRPQSASIIKSTTAAVGSPTQSRNVSPTQLQRSRKESSPPVVRRNSTVIVPVASKQRFDSPPLSPSTHHSNNTAATTHRKRPSSAAAAIVASVQYRYESSNDDAIRDKHGRLLEGSSHFVGLVTNCTHSSSQQQVQQPPTPSMFSPHDSATYPTTVTNESYVNEHTDPLHTHTSLTCDSELGEDRLFTLLHIHDMSEKLQLTSMHTGMYNHSNVSGIESGRDKSSVQSMTPPKYRPSSTAHSPRHYATHNGGSNSSRLYSRPQSPTSLTTSPTGNKKSSNPTSPLETAIQPLVAPIPPSMSTYTVTLPMVKTTKSTTLPKLKHMNESYNQYLISDLMNTVVSAEEQELLQYNQSAECLLDVNVIANNNSHNNATTTTVVTDRGVTRNMPRTGTPPQSKRAISPQPVPMVSMTSIEHMHTTTEKVPIIEINPEMVSQKSPQVVLSPTAAGSVNRVDIVNMSAGKNRQLKN